MIQIEKPGMALSYKENLVEIGPEAAELVLFETMDDRQYRTLDNKPIAQVS